MPRARSSNEWGSKPGHCWTRCGTLFPAFSLVLAMTLASASEYAGSARRSHVAASTFGYCTDPSTRSRRVCTTDLASATSFWANFNALSASDTATFASAISS